MRLCAQIACRIVTCLTLLGAPLAIAAGASGSVEARLLQSDGAPLEGAAVTLRRLGPGPVEAPRRQNDAGVYVMDQVNRAFQPEVLVVPTGASVKFPNSDSVSHQVYSFSPAKRFQLPLYRGKPYSPVNFDTPGIVTLGCNIHDNMIGWILITDADWFGRSDKDGNWRAASLPAGDYELSIWHPRLREPAARLQSKLHLDSGETGRVEFRASKAMRPAPLTGKSLEWDY